MSINRARKIVLINSCRQMFSGLPEILTMENSPIKGNKSLAQVIVNRIESVTKDSDEFKYCAAVIQTMIRSLGKDPISNSPLITNPLEIQRVLAENSITKLLKN